MSDKAEKFDRAPGAERTRVKESSTGGERETNNNRPRVPELSTDREAVFTHCQPLRQPLTPLTISHPLSSGDNSGASTSLSVSNSSSSSAVNSQTGPSTVSEFRLSANAPEFIPSNYTTVQEEVHYQEESYDPEYYPELSLADLVQDILNHLNSSPGSFEMDIGSITSTLNDWVTTEETLHELVHIIFTQSTSMPNFTYTGARLCNFLSHHLTLSPSGGNFRQLLLQRCRTEYDQRQQALMGDEETQRRFHTYVLFLGELYLNLEVKSGKGTVSRAEILLNALRDLMDTLFSLPKDRNLICAVKLLKLTGSVLEDAWKQSGKSHMDELIQKIEGILLDAQCSRDVRQMLLKLVELRSSNWGRVHAAAALSDATPDNDPNYYMNEPTFYTTDGTPFTAADPDYSEKYQEILEREDYFPEFYEENGNEESSGEEDEMEPEMEEAFEKFCMENERAKNL